MLLGFFGLVNLLFFVLVFVPVAQRLLGVRFGLIRQATRGRRTSPKLRGLRRGNPQLSWGFVVFGCGCSDYFRVRGMVALRRSKAWRWSAVGSASMGTSVVVSAMRTWLRERVARWSSRPP